MRQPEHIPGAIEAALNAVRRLVGVHKTRHQNSGADEISVAGLSGLLADDQHVLDAEVTAVAVAHSLATAINDFLVASGSGAFVKKTLAETITILGGTSRTFLVNAFHFPDPISEWRPVLQGAYLPASLTAKKCWLPLPFLKLGDIITAYNLVGDAIEVTALTLDCKLVRVNKADPLTTTDITNGGMVQVIADGNFDVAVNPDDETVATDKQYALEITGTTGVGDSIYIIGAEIQITRLI